MILLQSWVWWMTGQKNSPFLIYKKRHGGGWSLYSVKSKELRNNAFHGTNLKLFQETIKQSTPQPAVLWKYWIKNQWCAPTSKEADEGHCFFCNETSSIKKLSAKSNGPFSNCRCSAVGIIWFSREAVHQILEEDEYHNKNLSVLQLQF